MHLAIDVDVANNRKVIRLQPAIKVVEFNTRQLASYVVKELGRNCFRKRIKPFPLPARHEVITLVADHRIQFGNFVGAILQVGVHCNHHCTCCRTKAGLQRRRLSKIPIEADSLEPGITLTFFQDLLPCRVGTAVIDDDDFK